MCKFNSRKIEVISRKDGIEYHAIMKEPKKNLFDHVIPSVQVTSKNNSELSAGTNIIIYGYNTLSIRLKRTRWSWKK